MRKGLDSLELQKAKNVEKCPNCGYIYIDSELDNLAYCSVCAESRNKFKVLKGEKHESNDRKKADRNP